MMTAIARLFRPIALTLVVTVTITSFAYATKHVTTPIDPTTLHQKLTARGIGKSVKVTTLDGTETKGMLVSIGEDSFQVTPKNATQPISIPNAQVAKFANGDLPKAAKIGIGVGIAFGLLLIIGVISAHTV
jgi:hypothetical protein